MPKRGRYQQSSPSLSSRAIPACPLSRIFAMNSVMCARLTGSLCRLLSKDMALCRAWDLLSGSQGRSSLNGRVTDQFPSEFLTKLEFISRMNSMSTTDILGTSSWGPLG